MFNDKRLQNSYLYFILFFLLLSLAQFSFIYIYIFFSNLKNKAFLIDSFFFFWQYAGHKNVNINRNIRRCSIFVCSVFLISQNLENIICCYFDVLKKYKKAPCVSYIIISISIVHYMYFWCYALIFHSGSCFFLFRQKYRAADERQKYTQSRSSSSTSNIISSTNNNSSRKCI